jgi:hypothetical protein
MGRAFLVNLLFVLAIGLHEPKLELSLHNVGTNVDSSTQFFEDLAQDADFRLKLKELAELTSIFSRIAHERQNPDSEITLSDRESQNLEVRSAMKQMMGVLTKIPYKQIINAVEGQMSPEQEESLDTQLKVIANEKVTNMMADTMQDMQELVMNKELSEISDEFNDLMEKVETPTDTGSSMRLMGTHMKEAGKLFGKLATIAIPKMMKIEKDLKDRGAELSKELGFEIFPEETSDNEVDAYAFP